MSARDRMVRILTDAMVARGCTVAAARGYAGHAVDQLVGQAGGFLIYAGAVRDVLLADRFGPSSWEITTEEHIQDRHTWENPDA